MRLQIASDLHLDYFQGQWPGFRLIEPHPAADALVLAGDIAQGTQAIGLFGDWPVPVVYVSGNHEPYGTDRERMVDDLRALSRGTALVFLENDGAQFGGVRFLGSTLWSDFDLVPGKREEAMERAQSRRTDYRKIKMGGRLFEARDARRLHLHSRDFLASALREPFDGPTVVVSHHAPHARSLKPDWASSIQGAPFASDCSELLGAVDLWIHGHVHHSRDYRFEGARVVANPCGYLAEVREANHSESLVFDSCPHPQSQWENASFNPSLIIDL